MFDNYSQSSSLAIYSWMARLVLYKSINGILEVQFILLSKKYEWFNDIININIL